VLLEPCEGCFTWFNQRFSESYFFVAFPASGFAFDFAPGSVLGVSLVAPTEPFSNTFITDEVLPLAAPDDAGLDFVLRLLTPFRPMILLLLKNVR
jgi:hypothetical protein